MSYFCPAVRVIGVEKLSFMPPWLNHLLMICWPFTQSRALVRATHVERYTEFAIFAHVIPDKPVPLQTFLPDIWRLFWHVHAVLLEVL